MRSVGTRVSEVLSELNVTQMELAKHLNKKPGYVSRLIKEYRQPRAELLMQLARVLGVEVAWLATEEGPKRTDRTAPPADFSQPARKLSRAVPPEHLPARDTSPPPKAKRTPTVVVKEDRYPNRRKAIETARSLGAPEEALKNVESMMLKGSDMTEIEWLDEIKTEVRRIKRGLHQTEERGDDLSLEDPESTGDTTLDAMRELERLKAEEENNR